MRREAQPGRKPSRWHVHLFAAVLCPVLAFTPAGAVTLPIAAPAISQGEAAGADVEEDVAARELGVFRAAEVSLLEAITIAGRQHAGARVADVSFDGGAGAPVYRVRTVLADQVWEDDVDARTGAVSGRGHVLSLKKLEAEDRGNLMALKRVRQQLRDAVLIAEKAASGKAISGGLIDADGKPTFIIFVVGGDDHLEQVTLGPP
jgi:hypothetical protein